MKNISTDRISRKGKGNLFETLVSVSLLMVFIIVIITGLLSHQRLNYIIDTVKSGIRPDRKLILVKEINNNLSEAENSVKSFSLTRSDDYMVRFYELAENTSEKLDELDEMVSNTDRLAPYIDTLNQLVGDKFTILDRLLSIQDEFRVQQAMQQVVESIKEQEISDTPSVSIPVTPPAVQDTAKNIPPVKKENFFSRIFKRKNRQPEGSMDTISPEAAKDTVQVVRATEPGISIEKISEEVGKVQSEVLSRDRRLRQEEWDLLKEDKEIMTRIRHLIAFMEEKEKENRLVITKDAELKAGEVKTIIVTFGIIASFFILLAALVVFYYTKRNNEYKAVLVQARKDAEELARAKEMFLANMSHEIRTPMNIISGFLSQVLKGPLDEAQHEQLMIIKKSSDHLLELLNDLLDLSKLQADRLELVETNFSPAEVIAEMQLSLEPAAQAKNLRFITECDPGLPRLVYGDPVRLRQILFNLISNAIKFTDQGSITVRSFVRTRDNEKALLVFEFADTGIGLTEAETEKIFHTFEKASSRPGSNTEGAGLGLSITKKLVDLLGGKIQVRSRPGEGSVFTVEIQYKIGNEDVIEGPADLTISDKPLKDLQILVVDDDEYNRRLARIILEKYECRIYESGSAEEAIDIIESTSIDLVLMDIHLPGISGPEAAGRIKEIGNKTGRFIPVIAVSATISKGDLEKFRQSGLDDFVLKPYKEETLIEMIGRFTGNFSGKISLEKPSTGAEADPITPDQTGNAPEYDLEPLKVSSGGNDEFYREMVSMFLENTDKGLTDLKHHIESKEWEEAAGLAHKIISPCRHLKAHKLSSLLKQVENIAKSPSMIDSADEIIIKARIEFNLIREDIFLKNKL